MQPQDIPAFANFLSDKPTALRYTIKGPVHTFFQFLKIRGWDGEHVRWVPPVFSLPASGNFCLSMTDKEEACTTGKQSEEKKDSCVHACYLVEYSQSSSECIEVVIKGAGPSGSFKKQGAFAVRVRDKRRELLRRTVRSEHCANYDSP